MFCSVVMVISVHLTTFLSWPSSCNILVEIERAVCFALIVLCFVTVNVLWLFLTVPLVSPKCVIMVFRDHTNLLFDKVVNQYFMHIRSVVTTLLEVILS